MELSNFKELSSEELVEVDGGRDYNQMAAFCAYGAAATLAYPPAACAFAAASAVFWIADTAGLSS